MRIIPLSLETSRFIQDTATNLMPKAILARSKADLAETSFIEILESILVYYGPKFLGEGIFRKLYAPNQKTIQKNARAAIALSSAIIPLTEFTLPYFKNLFTLKVFKQADFKNIANLNKNNEDNKKQKHVEKSAKKHIKTAIALGISMLGISQLILRGKCENLKDLILEPGTKLFKKGEKADFINKYFSLDFADKNGKLALSKGQLTSCVIAGGFGYLGASKDRGKEDFKETLLRYPLVGFYVITGSELFEKGMKKILKKDKLNPAIPFVFSILVMGLFVTGITHAFTKKHYNKENKKMKMKNINFDEFRLSLR